MLLPQLLFNPFIYYDIHRASARVVITRLLYIQKSILAITFLLCMASRVTFQYVFVYTQLGGESSSNAISKKIQITPHESGNSAKIIVQSKCDKLYVIVFLLFFYPPLGRGLPQRMMFIDVGV